MSLDPGLDPRDALLQAHTPAVMVPRFGPLPIMEKPGHRYLVAASGLWLEVLRPWLTARVQVAYSEVPLPFGEVEQSVQYAFRACDLARMIDLFTVDAVAALPNECAAWAVYDERTGALDYRPLPADAASPGGVTFQRPPLADREHLAVDLHSHGAMKAFFSGTDDEDDAGEVKVSVVAGTVDRDATFAIRLCLLGTFVGDES
jgi:PRTRC genetic system protein A